VSSALVVTTEGVVVAKFNPAHVPAGSSAGGQFAHGSAGGGIASLSVEPKVSKWVETGVRDSINRFDPDLLGSQKVTVELHAGQGEVRTSTNGYEFHEGGHWDAAQSTVRIFGCDKPTAAAWAQGAVEHELGHAVFDRLSKVSSTLQTTPEGKKIATTAYKPLIQLAKANYKHGGVSDYSRAWKGSPTEEFAEMMKFKTHYPKKYEALHADVRASFEKCLDAAKTLTKLGVA